MTLAPTADGKQPGTTESPLLLGFLAAGRQVDKKASIEDESIARMADSPETSLMMNGGCGEFGADGRVPNQSTGAITGSLNGYTVSSQPTNGTVTVTGDTYTYTPTVPARLRAGLTTQPDYDSFGVIDEWPAGQHGYSSDPARGAVEPVIDSGRRPTCTE